MATEDIYAQHFSKVSLLVTRVKQSTRLKPLELMVLLLYPLTISLGQLISFTTSLISSAASEANYFTSKGNIINQVFVKRGWFWTVVLLGYYLYQHKSLIRNKLKVISRILLSTVWWILFTQWFFGIPIMDRVFVASGGECVLNEATSVTRAINEFDKDQASSLSCRKLRGQWVGGHDPSGHVFLLVHGSIMIWFEILELGGFVTEIIEVLNKLKSCKDLKSFLLILIKSSAFGIFLILFIWWWMLLITSIHFHTASEKLSGLLFGLVGLLIYILPRFV